MKRPAACLALSPLSLNDVELAELPKTKKAFALSAEVSGELSLTQQETANELRARPVDGVLGIVATKIGTLLALAGQYTSHAKSVTLTLLGRGGSRSQSNLAPVVSRMDPSRQTRLMVSQRSAGIGWLFDRWIRSTVGQ